MTSLRPAATGRADRWCVRWRPLPRARLRLFCLPHAGGGAAVFRRWAQRLGPEIEVVALRLPGREHRLDEPPYDRAAELVADLVRAVEPELYRPYAWFGHSMGAGLAFGACRAARRLGLPEPRRLVVAASPAPHLPRREEPVHDKPAPVLLRRLRELDGTSGEVLDDTAVVNVLLPALRGDFAVAETGSYHAERPLDCPITVWGGDADDSVTVDELEGWRLHSSAPVDVRLHEGGHFFVHRQERLPDDLRRQLLGDL